MVRVDRERLCGLVEVDEVFLGGVKPGIRGRGALGKVLVLVAVEDKGELALDVFGLKSLLMRPPQP